MSVNPCKRHRHHCNVHVLCIYAVERSAATVGSKCTRLLPTIHEMCAALGHAQCCSLSFLHSLCVPEATSYPNFTGKKVWLNRIKTMDICALENFADQDQDHITPDVINQSKQLVKAVYINQGDKFETSDLKKLRLN